MELSDAIKKPFSDWSKLAVGSLLGLIPIVNFTVIGYGLQNAKTPNKLPEFSMDSFVLGLKSVGVCMVYGLLTLLVMLPFTFGALGSLVNPLMTGTFDPVMLMPLIGVALIAVFIGLLSIPMNMAAMLVLGRTESMQAALDIPAILRYAYRWAFIKYTLVALLLGCLIAVVGTLIPFVGWLITGYVGAVFTWTYLGANAPK
ncbi:MAG: DUF4013 domain-containing protein [Candidatus Altiarchaeota archaeon]|nr:DUF4013 domain-containing protein [Candidatus Altiarchaeota archaeon]